MGDLRMLVNEDTIKRCDQMKRYQIFFPQNILDKLIEVKFLFWNLHEFTFLLLVFSFLKKMWNYCISSPQIAGI